MWEDRSRSTMGTRIGGAESDGTTSAFIQSFNRIPAPILAILKILSILYSFKRCSDNNPFSRVSELML